MCAIFSSTHFFATRASHVTIIEMLQYVMATRTYISVSRMLSGSISENFKQLKILANEKLPMSTSNMFLLRIKKKLNLDMPLI